MAGHYTSEFKRLAVHRLLTKQGSVRELARELGVAKATLFDWQREVVRVQDAMGIKPDKPTRTAGEKLRLVFEASQLPDEKLGEWLRRAGLHEDELRQWREAMLKAVQPGKPQRSSEDARRIRELERELKRKDRALAEAAALLVLKKKVEALWEEGEEDEDEPGQEDEDDDTAKKSE